MPPLAPDRQLLARLCGEQQELPWLEFKENLSDPVVIGKYISALSNSATLNGMAHGYVVWGARDGDHALVGTSFDPFSAKGAGNEDLIPWLSRLLDPSVFFDFRFVDTGGSVRALILQIDAARETPVAFKSTRYVRIGSYTQPLANHPEHEARLWDLLRGNNFESGIAANDLSESRVLEVIDYPALFDLLQLPLPETRKGVVDRLIREGVVGHSVASGLFVTNLGALLFARDLSVFQSVAHKGVRVVTYEGTSRAGGVEQQRGSRGYASGFSGLLDYIQARLPQSDEVVEHGLRVDRPLYPVTAVRELVANMLIHQDLSLGGSRPIVEIFSNRVEFTNPGVPLIDVRRFIGQRPPSRNEAVAAFMTRARISEERGSGWEKIATEVELNQLPAPKISADAQHTKVALYAPRPFSEMSRSERIEAVYLHTALRFVSGEATTNSSLRERFAISEQNSAQASRLLADAVEAGLILIEDASAGNRLRRYIPFWATEIA
ncbi:MAG: ATP-binding protein [Humibacter sp.]